MQKLVSKTTIEGRVFYRIHTIMDNELIGLEAVEKTGSGRLRKVLNWSDGGELEDFMNELENIEIVAEEESEPVIHYLENFAVTGRDELARSFEEDGLVLIYFIEAHRGYYAVVGSEERLFGDKATFFQAYTVQLDRDGGLKNVAAITNQEDFDIVMNQLAIELGDQQKVIFQYAYNEYCGLRREGDLVDFIFMQEEELEEGGNKYTSTLDRIFTMTNEIGTTEITVHPQQEYDERYPDFIVEMLSIISRNDATDIVKEEI